MTANDGVLIELDARNRASLGRFARHRRYLLKLEPSGAIVLTPVRIVPAEEAAHLDRNAVVDELADLPDEAPKLAEAAARRREHLSECATRVYPDHSYRCTCAPSTRESYE